jgi:hypothetical protein
MPSDHHPVRELPGGRSSSPEWWGGPGPGAASVSSCASREFSHLGMQAESVGSRRA